MKFTFDSEHFLVGKGRSIWCIVLFIIAAFLIFHLGIMVGMCKARHHMEYGMGGYNQGSFTVSAHAMPQNFTQGVPAGRAQMMRGGQNVQFTQASAAAMPSAGMRVVRFDESAADGANVIYYRQ